VKAVKKIAILGGGEEELNILSEFHRKPNYEIIGIYDRDDLAVGLQIAEIIGIPKYSDRGFLAAFQKADYVIITEKRRIYEEEIELLKKEKIRLINPSEAVSHLAIDTVERNGDRPPWPAHLEMALKYIRRITDRERLLKWLLEISIRAVNASSGSIMLFSEDTGELYIGYASGLSREIVKNTRQKVGEGISGMVAAEREPALICDLVDTPLYSGNRERQDIQSAISAPLLFEDNLLGVLNISTNRGETPLTDDDVKTIRLLASKISPILEQHLRIDTSVIREKEYQIRNFLESLFRSENGFHEKFSSLCRTLCEKLNADTVSIYTATDEGDWLILGGGDQHAPITDTAPRIHCIKGSLARAYLSGEEVLMTEATHDATLQIKSHKDSITSIYIPLVHNEALGVMVIEFSILEELESFMKLKDNLRFQVSFFVHAQLRELKQHRKMKRYEELSTFTPYLMAIEDTSGRIRHLPEIISSILNASMGSFYFKNDAIDEKSYFNFPEKDNDLAARMQFDDELRERAVGRKSPECISFLTRDVGTYDTMPLYNSAISYPIYVDGDFIAVYNGYNKKPETPLDSSVFGEYELGLMGKVGDILAPILRKRKKQAREHGPVSFNELLRSNQKIFLERITEEIERADRYHHGFTVTLFHISGLNDYYKVSSHHALELINDLSRGIRQVVRKTDYFSWIETDLFGVLSLESFQRMGDLEKRLCRHIETSLEEKGLLDRERFHPKSAFALYPGASDTAADLIGEANNKIHK